MGKDKRTSKAGRDAGGFLALPHVVLDSPAFLALTPHAKALLLDIARQLGPYNNGMLLCTRERMRERGWTSNDMLTKAKRELLEAGFLFQTVMGQRPNKAAWYAVTWQALDKIDGFDPGAAQLFVRSAYRQPRLVAKTQSLSRPTVQEAA